MAIVLAIETWLFGNETQESTNGNNFRVPHEFPQYIYEHVRLDILGHVWLPCVYALRVHVPPSVELPQYKSAFVENQKTYL